MAGLNDAPLVSRLALPAVCLLIAFLGYFSQYLLYHGHLDPGPPSSSETLCLNLLLLCVWYTYSRAVLVDPGRLAVPVHHGDDMARHPQQRWCFKCDAPKPPRAHHCRSCRRCVPKMDHHCPWTANCVSMTTFPHFLRFIVYANLALWALARLLWKRFWAIWLSRHMPAYLGPSLSALICLSLTSIVCFVTTVALGIMLVTTLRTWLLNCTMIEGWQSDRHEALLDRATGRDWWHLTGPDGKQVRLQRVEFPYDIGFFANMAQAMGTSNPLLWLFPFAGNPLVGANQRGLGWEWEENGFNPNEGMWPPPDPDKMYRRGGAWPSTRHSEVLDDDLGPEERKRAFQLRQEQDVRRRALLMAELEEVDDYDMVDMNETPRHQSLGWSNSDGERLGDYGVDEDMQDADAQAIYGDTGAIDDNEQDNVPLGELLRRRTVLKRDNDDD
ncbi:hypothetical protein CDD82_5878 [Ophiocordyceps australis]|uniref:Palmitoyltransferase PFA4 n=1 Tax=Ophiocordyceps australis TaxID=1399860 RepID=A0A2C5ZKE8_9HYPO|nr:hypothetical protein CDD82_5878 [Ophiocordyceps australis]